VEGTRSREAAALVGRTFGEFVVREPLSSGGFGMVFRAEQPALAREAVIKVLHTRLLASETVVQRFLREARLASRLDHPYAAHTYAFGAEPDGVLWIAMELVRGTPLDRMLILHGPITLERFVPLLERICEVVHTAHEQGIVHRDLKPGNVMVLARAGRLLPKLLDFGIAKLDDVESPVDVELPPVPAAMTESAGALDETIDPASVFAETAAGPTPSVEPPPAPTSPKGPALVGQRTPPGVRGLTTDGGSASTGRLTHVGVTMGSPLYMAPEQWSDAAAVGPPTDLYALGVLCFEALTGRLPFKGDSHMQIAMAHARQSVPPLGAGFPRPLDAVLARVLAKHPADRYPDALEFAAAFRAASGVASDAVSLPRLEERVREFAIARAPQPLARAVAGLEAARNAHQARDALWQLVRIAVRLVGVAALAAHSHVRPDQGTTEPILGEGLRRLRRRALADGDWLALARELVASFVELRDAHPIPELVDFLTTPAGDPLDELIRLRAHADEAGGGTDERVRELLELALPLVARLLDRLAFLSDYQLAVPDGDGAEVWVGGRRDQPPRRQLARGDLPAGRPVLLDASGAPVVALWPFVQVQVPAAGEPPALFFIEGRGRRGARLVALPDPFEREDEELWEALGGMLDDTSEGESDSGGEEVCPYPGLAPFTGAEAAHFLGRERETESFLNRLRVTPLLAVVGPSGAGKSSFVQAGVLPGLPDGWRSVTIRPGPAPMVSMLARLASLGGVQLPEQSGVTDSSPNALGSALRAAAAARKSPCVVVVDQLEELFTLCEDAGERERFAETLVRFARTADDPVRVVVTLRDDFLLRVEALAAFRSRLGPALQLLTTPAPADLKRILIEPLRRAGYEFDDPGLPDEMVEALGQTPGALALLSFTASKLWELRDRRFHQIGHKAYRSLGGVGGALAQHAETTLQAMRPDEQRLVREVFRHLVTAEGTRAVLSQRELDELLGVAGKAVVEKLVAARLLVVSESDAGGERVEVTHEALLDAWPRLVGWRREDAEGARLRDQLRAAARQWEERGRPSGLLWRGDALAEYRLWRARYPGALTAVEEAFAAASLADAARSRKLRRMLLASVFLALVAVAVVLFVQNTRVERQRARAVDNERKVASGAARMHDLLLTQYESQGRRLLLADDPVQALAYLHKAAELGASGPAHDFLVAQAVSATDGERFVVRHDSGVVRVRFSPDGSRLATAGYDKRARLWSAETGALTGDLALEAPVTRIEWSPDGRLVATADLSGALTLWDAASGRRLHQLALSVRAQEIAFSRDGARLLAAAVDESVTLWEPASGKRIATLRPPTTGSAPDHGSLAAASPVGPELAVGDATGAIRLWDGTSGRALATLPGDGNPIVWLRFSPDGRRLVATGEKRIAIWDLARRRRLSAISYPQPITGASFSPDGRLLVSSSDDGSATVWDVAAGAALRTLEGHRVTVTRAIFSPDGSQIATASEDGTAILWDAASGRRLARRVGHRGMLRDLVFDPAGRLLATASADGSVIVSSALPAQRVTFLRGHQGGVLWVELSPSGTHALTASTDGSARIWDPTTGRELVALAHGSTVVIARFAPDGERIATGGEDGVIRIWDARSGARRAELRGHEGAVLSLAWDPAGKRLVSAGVDGSVRVWSADSGKPIDTLRPHGGLIVYGAAFTPSGQVVTTGADDTIRLVEPSGRELASFLDRDGRRRSSLDSRGRLGVSATFNRSAKIWNLGDGATRFELVGHAGDVYQAEWSPDDQFIVTASADASARIWEARTGHLLAVLDHQGEWVLSAAFSPEGDRVVTGRGDGMATVWELPRFSGGRSELGRIVRCRVPYELADQDSIAPRPRDLEACRQTGAAR
jgi:WD40 repeat protein/serine/threonine protein kinase